MGSARLQCCQQHLGKRFVFIRVTNENVTRHFTDGCNYLLSKVSPLVEAKAHRCGRQRQFMNCCYLNRSSLARLPAMGYRREARR